MSAVWPYLAAIVPTILVAILFYFLIKTMMEGDRRERLAQAQFEAAEDRRSAPSPGAAPWDAHEDAPGAADRPDVDETPSGEREENSPGNS